jgi:hypothetical protein
MREVLWLRTRGRSTRLDTTLAILAGGWRLVLRGRERPDAVRLTCRRTMFLAPGVLTGVNLNTQDRTRRVAYDRIRILRQTSISKMAATTDH